MKYMSIIIIIIIRKYFSSLHLFIVMIIRNKVRYKRKKKDLFGLFISTDYINLFEYDIPDRRILSIFVEGKVFRSSIYQLLSFDKDD